MSSCTKKRIAYLAMTLILLGIEVFIALFMRDAFIRPYVGDMLAVVFVYTFLRIFIPERGRLLPLYVFLFAVGLEGLQAVDIVQVFGLQDSRFFRTLIGSTFDVKDIACYGIGCILTGIYEFLRWKRHVCCFRGKERK